MPLDIPKLRAQFPALEREYAGVPVAYFDGPGGTQVPRAVGEAVCDYLYHRNANTHWAYPTSAETDEIIARSRQAMADLLRARPDEIAFGANMTTLTFHLARALGRQWTAGDEVVVTELDHHANVAPWTALAKERGITIRVARMIPERGILDWEDLERQVGPRTRLLAIGAASNALGTVNDVRRAASLAKAAGALTFVDAVHFTPHAVVDVQAMGCDFLACSAYKFYGPHIGVLFARRSVQETLDVPRLAPAPDTPPELLETGTLNHEGIAGAAAAVDFLASWVEGSQRRERLEASLTALHRRGRELFARLYSGLSALPGVELFGPPPEAERTPTISFVVQGIASEEVARFLAGRGVFVSHGDFYAATVAERLGHAQDGLVRAGCAAYTTVEEIDRLVEGVDAVRREK